MSIALLLAPGQVLPDGFLERPIEVFFSEEDWLNTPHSILFDIGFEGRWETDPNFPEWFSAVPRGDRMPGSHTESAQSLEQPAVAINSYNPAAEQLKRYWENLEKNTNRIILVNAVIFPFSAMPQHPRMLRVNGWPGFLEKTDWETAGLHLELSLLTELSDQLGKKLFEVPAVTGMVAPRILATIIQEAELAVEENVSSPDEIDLAMKGGTNYPLGPFEWKKRIGEERIYNLIKMLALENDLYENFPAGKK